MFKKRDKKIGSESLFCFVLFHVTGHDYFVKNHLHMKWWCVCVWFWSFTK